MRDFDGRVALVTGGTIGIRRGAIDALVAVGAAVAISGTDVDGGLMALGSWASGAGSPS